ncbi:MAG: hypothetical protein GX811_10555, partial [Lentisphaerae bacterium]|nr:hypothetical protein [Lentisphaerota bacterium]
MKKLFTICLLTLICLSSAGADEEAQYNAVVSLYNAGQWEAAIKIITEREKQNMPDNMRAKYAYAKGLAYEKGNKIKEAQAAYEHLIVTHPNAPESDNARIALIYNDYSTGQHESVIKRSANLKTAALSTAQQCDLALMLAESQNATGQLKEALDNYSKAIKLGFNKDALASKMFAAYIKLGKHNELIASSNNGVPGVQPDLVALARAESFLALKQMPRVLDEFKKIPESSANYPRAAFAAAQALVSLNRTEEAEKPLELALQKLPPPIPPEAYLVLAECQIAGKRFDDAEKSIAKALGEAKKLGHNIDANAAMLRIRVAKDKGDMTALARILKDTRQTIPQDKLPDALYSLLFALHQSGDHKSVCNFPPEDIATLKNSRFAGDAFSIFYESLEKTGANEKARELLEDFVKTDQSGERLYKARIRLARYYSDQKEWMKAEDQYAWLLQKRDLTNVLGKELADETRYNAIVVKHSLNKADEALAMAEPMLKENLTPETRAALLC